MLRRIQDLLPTQYNTDHHEVIIRPFMQHHCLTMQLTSPISSENLMQSRSGELGLQSVGVGGAGDLYHINYMAIATIICIYILLGLRQPREIYWAQYRKFMAKISE